MRQPFISVIIPLFNKEKEVLRSVNSVLMQTFADFEVVVIKDGSTDKGSNIVNSINDDRIRVIDQPNAGVSAARNRGIDEAKADLIAFLDADDEWGLDFLEIIIRLRKKFPSCEVFATNYSFRRENNYIRPTIIRGLPQGFKEGILKDYFMVATKSDPPLWASALAVTKKALEVIGGFPVGVVAGEDLLTWARLATKYDISYLIEPKAYHWEPVEFSGRPGRLFNVPDIVGQELEVLLKTSNSEKNRGLRDYIALWHRMRASTYLRLGQRRSAIEEIQKAVFFSGFNLKLIMYGALSFLPHSLAIGLLRFRKRLTELTR